MNRSIENFQLSQCIFPHFLLDFLLFFLYIIGMNRKNRIAIAYSEFIHTTKKAWGVKLEDAIEWFPKKYCAINKVKQKVKAPEWLLKRKGLIEVDPIEDFFESLPF